MHGSISFFFSKHPQIRFWPQSVRSKSHTLASQSRDHRQDSLVKRFLGGMSTSVANFPSLGGMATSLVIFPSLSLAFTGAAGNHFAFGTFAELLDLGFDIGAACIPARCVR
jgi:hypothetical protein